MHTQAVSVVHLIESVLRSAFNHTTTAYREESKGSKMLACRKGIRVEIAQISASDAVRDPVCSSCVCWSRMASVSFSQENLPASSDWRCPYPCFGLAACMSVQRFQNLEPFHALCSHRKEIGTSDMHFMRLSRSKFGLKTKVHFAQRFQPPPFLPDTLFSTLSSLINSITTSLSSIQDGSR